MSRGPMQYESGLCQAGNHHLCPQLMRAHRITAKGTELRELLCPCKCGHPGTKNEESK